MKKLIFTLAAFAAGLALFAAEPIMRVGLLTDTHIKAKKSSCERLAGAYALFRKQNVDMIINTGDIADVYDVRAYRNYRDTVNKAYEGVEKRPAEIFVYANHDRIRREKESCWDVFKDVKKELGIPNDPYDIIKFKGYTFVVIPQFVNWEKYAQMLETAAKENPDKPFFVLDHIPPKPNDPKSPRHKLLKKYPNAVVFCGHAHATLRNERLIWQDGFTAVRLGSMYDWRLSLVGSVPQSFNSDMFAVLEVYKDKLVIRRYSALKQQEYRANDPWTIPLPFDPATAPYTFEKRAAESTAPEFPAGAGIKLAPNANGVQITFPKSTHPDGVLKYVVELFCENNGSWQRLSRQDVNGDFMFDEQERKAEIMHTISAGFFDVGKKYRVTVSPVHVFGKQGRCISAEFSAPEFAKHTIIYECKEPMKELLFKSGLAGGEVFKLDKDGFYIHNNYNGRLEYPGEVWAGKAGTRFRFIIDMHLKQGKFDPWSVVLRNPKPLKNASHRIATECGDSGAQRFVIEFTKRKSAFKYYLLIREGETGKIRFNYVRIERLDNK